MNNWVFWSVELFVAAHFVALVVLLTHAAILRRKERRGRKGSARGRRPLRRVLV